MIRRPPRSTLSSSSAASDVYKRQRYGHPIATPRPVKDASLQSEAHRSGVVLIELGRFLAVQRQAPKEVHALPHVLVRVVCTENDLGHPERLSRAVERRRQVVAAGRHPHCLLYT